MGNYKLEKEDYINIFKEVLKRIEKVIENYNNYDFTPDQAMAFKHGLCILIDSCIKSLDLATDYTVFFIIQKDCEYIIYDATGNKFHSHDYYWHSGYRGTVSVEEWYKPRIKCIEKTIEYLENL